jgi:hypothetical protein
MSSAPGVLELFNPGVMDLRVIGDGLIASLEIGCPARKILLHLQVL